MIWVLLGLLVYLQIGVVLVAWLFGGMAVQAGWAHMILLVVLWPFAIPLFRFLLHTRRVMRALKEWEQSSE